MLFSLMSKIVLETSYSGNSCISVFPATYLARRTAHAFFSAWEIDTPVMIGSIPSSGWPIWVDASGAWLGADRTSEIYNIASFNMTKRPAFVYKLRTI